MQKGERTSSISAYTSLYLVFYMTTREVPQVLGLASIGASSQLAATSFLAVYLFPQAIFLPCLFLSSPSFMFVTLVAPSASQGSLVAHILSM